MKFPYSRKSDFSEKSKLLVEEFVRKIHEQRKKYYLDVSLGADEKKERKNLQNFIRQSIDKTTQEISFISFKESAGFYLSMQIAILQDYVKGIIRWFRHIDWFESR